MSHISISQEEKLGVEEEISLSSAINILLRYLKLVN